MTLSTEAVLTLAPAEAGPICRQLSGDGQGELINTLAKSPLAISEYRSGIGRGRDRLRIDTSHLSRFDGTDYCQWFGRISSGYFVPFGRIMQIVLVAKGPE